MSGSIDANQIRTGNFLDALAHPTVVNPLAAYSSAADAAGKVWNIRKVQAEQGMGEALQQATDPNTGVVDYPKAQQIAAGMGPHVALAMQEGLKTASHLRGQQNEQAGQLMALTGQLSASLMNDPSDANVATIRARAVNAGMPPSAIAEIDRVAALPVEQRGAEAYKHNIGSIDALGRLSRGGYGVPSDVNTGTTQVPVVNQPGTPWSPPTSRVGAGGVTLGPTPAERGEPFTYTDAAGQHVTTRGEFWDKTGTAPWAGGQQVGGRPNAAPTQQPPPPPPGSPNVRGSPPPANGGVGNIPAAHQFAPGVVPGPPLTPGGPAVTTPAAPGSPLGIGGALNAPRPQGALAGGVPVAGPNYLVPQTGAPSAPGPAAQADANVILAGMQNARANPLAGGAAVAGPGAPSPEAGWGTREGSYGTAPAPAPAAAQPAAQPPAPVSTVPQTGNPAMRGVTGARPGQNEATIKTGEQSAAMGGALAQRADQAPVNKANYANMLSDLNRIKTMGPGTDREVAINSFIQKVTGGSGITMTRDEVAAANSFAKLGNIAIGQQLAAIGGTDARQQLFMGSNPHLDLSKLGNEQIIHMLMGNEDAIQAKGRAWTQYKAANGADKYDGFQTEFNRHFDPRVFQSQYMQQGSPELAGLRTTLEKEGAAAVQKFKDDTTYARKQGWIN